MLFPSIRIFPFSFTFNRSRGPDIDRSLTDGSRWAEDVLSCWCEAGRTWRDVWLTWGWSSLAPGPRWCGGTCSSVTVATVPSTSAQPLRKQLNRLIETSFLFVLFLCVTMQAGGTLPYVHRYGAYSVLEGSLSLGLSGSASAPLENSREKEILDIIRIS
jgi:hypothetical protein